MVRETSQGSLFRVTAVVRLPVHHHSADFISGPFGSLSLFLDLTNRNLFIFTAAGVVWRILWRLGV